METKTVFMSPPPLAPAGAWVWNGHWFWHDQLQPLPDGLIWCGPYLPPRQKRAWWKSLLWPKMDVGGGVTRLVYRAFRVGPDGQLTEAVSL